MKKLRPWMYGLASTVAVVAPVATVISCGETTTSGTNTAYPVHSKGAYNLTSFTNDAKRYNDSSRWIGGISYHALNSVASIVRALADQYGYSTDLDATTKKTALETNLPSGTVYVNADGTTFGTPTADQLKAIKALKTFTQSGTKLGDFSPASLGENGGLNFSQLSAFNIMSTNTLSAGANDAIAVDTKGDANMASSLSINWYSTYDDPKNPNATILVFNDLNTHVTFEMRIQGAKDAYPKIEAGEFKTNFLATIRDSFSQFLALYDGLLKGSFGGFLSASDSGIIRDHPAISEIKFLVNKLFKNGQPTLDADFDAKLTALNDMGAFHWLAIKTLYFGFDSTMTTGQMSPFTYSLIKGKILGLIDTGVDYGATANGLPSFAANQLGFLQWIGYNNLVKQPGEPTAIPDDVNFTYLNSSKRAVFVATKTPAENLTAADYTAADMNMLKAYTDYMDSQIKPK